MHFSTLASTNGLPFWALRKCQRLAWKSNSQLGFANDLASLVQLKFLFTRLCCAELTYVSLGRLPCSVMPCLFPQTFLIFPRSRSSAQVCAEQRETLTPCLFSISWIINFLDFDRVGQEFDRPSSTNFLSPFEEESFKISWSLSQMRQKKLAPNSWENSCCLGNPL